MEEEFIDEESVRTVSYADLDDDLKEKVRHHFRNDEFLVPDDWHDWVLEGINEKYKDILTIDYKSITYDMGRDSVGWSGTIDFEHPEIKKLIPKKYYSYEDDDWLYDVSDIFKDDEMVEGYNIDSDRIYDDIDVDISPEDLDAFLEGEKDVKIDEANIGRLSRALKTYKDYDTDALEIINSWLEGMTTASDIFFQDTYNIKGEDYETVIGNISSDVEKEIETFMEDTFFSEINEYIYDAFQEFKKNMVDSYDYYYTDEYANEVLSDREFNVEHDSGGNQVEVLDLDGTW